ncbi:MAG: MBL fold metallo-hydrolase [Acidobacteria bacterium]|nr:MBL fold metallo-hydrolase [Acidobacteriota bacterium]
MIKQFEVPGLAQYSYIVSSEGQAVVIDAMRDIAPYLAYAREHGLTIAYVTETHIHADFAAGSKALAEAVNAELALSGYDHDELYQYAMPHCALKDGDSIEFGRLRLQALHTPGHTPEHLSFLLFDLDGSATEPSAIFTGDFLFLGSLGRPDLLGEEAKHTLAHQLYRSLHQRIASVPDSATVYPGHGAGSLCGAGMSEGGQSTLGFERQTQHLFRLDEDDFVRQILASVPPMPAYYPRMKRLNAVGAPAPLPSMPSLSAAQLQQQISANPGNITLLDTRDVESFATAHIPGAINLAAGPSLPLWAGWLLDPEKPIVIITGSDDRTLSHDANPRTSLLRVGLDRIAGQLPFSRWAEAEYETQATPLLSAPEAAAAAQHAAPHPLLIDVRNPAEWATGHIAGATNIALGDLATKLSTLNPAQPVITICGSGYRAAAAASLLAARGFQNVSIMDGGMAAWAEHNLPTTHP